MRINEEKFIEALTIGYVVAQCARIRLSAPPSRPLADKLKIINCKCRHKQFVSITLINPNYNKQADDSIRTFPLIICIYSYSYIHRGPTQHLQQHRVPPSAIPQEPQIFAFSSPARGSAATCVYLLSKNRAFVERFNFLQSHLQNKFSRTPKRKD